MSEHLEGMTTLTETFDHDAFSEHVQRAYKIGDGKTSFYEPSPPVYGKPIHESLLELIRAGDKLANTLFELEGKGFLKDEKAEARKRSHDDLIKKRKNLYKRGA